MVPIYIPLNSGKFSPVSSRIREYILVFMLAAAFSVKVKATILSGEHTFIQQKVEQSPGESFSLPRTRPRYHPDMFCLRGNYFCLLFGQGKGLINYFGKDFFPGELHLLNDFYPSSNRENFSLKIACSHRIA